MPIRCVDPVFEIKKEMRQTRWPTQFNNQKYKKSCSIKNLVKKTLLPKCIEFDTTRTVDATCVLKILIHLSIKKRTIFHFEFLAFFLGFCSCVCWRVAGVQWTLLYKRQEEEETGLIHIFFSPHPTSNPTPIL